MKRILIIFLLIVSLVATSGCKKSKMDDIIVSVHNESIKLKNKTTDTSIDNRNIFTYAFEKNTLAAIKLVNFGVKVSVDIENNEPDQVTIKDGLLNSNGEIIYSDKEIVQVPIVKENSKSYSFTVERHWAALLSSQYVKDKIDFRGYEITVTSGNHESVYYFVLKTASL